MKWKKILWAVPALAAAALVWRLWPESVRKPEYDESELKALNEERQKSTRRPAGSR